MAEARGAHWCPVLPLTRPFGSVHFLTRGTEVSTAVGTASSARLVWKPEPLNCGFRKHQDMDWDRPSALEAQPCQQWGNGCEKRSHGSSLSLFGVWQRAGLLSCLFCPQAAFQENVGRQVRPLSVPLRLPGPCRQRAHLLGMAAPHRGTCSSGGTQNQGRQCWGRSLEPAVPTMLALEGHWLLGPSKVQKELLEVVAP